MTDHDASLPSPDEPSDGLLQYQRRSREDRDDRSPQPIDPASTPVVFLGNIGLERTESRVTRQGSIWDNTGLNEFLAEIELAAIKHIRHRFHDAGL